MRQIESDAFKGWKIHVHDPGEFPEVNKKGMQIGLGKEVSIRHYDHQPLNKDIKARSYYLYLFSV